MFIKNILLIASFTWGAMFSIHAQNVKSPDSYNYSRGIEAYRNDKIEEAYQTQTKYTVKREWRLMGKPSIQV